MSHELYLLVEKIKSEPLLITAQGLSSSLSYLERRNEPGSELAILGGRKPKREELQFNEDTKVGVITVAGPLSYMQYAPVCGEEQTSYQGIEAQFDALVAAGAKTILFDYDTPGGQAYGVFETAQRFRRIADESGIKLIGYVDGSAYSAGYGLLSAMHEKIGNPDSGVGSIGVLVHLQNINKAKRQAGIEDTFIFAGKNKIPFDAEGEFKEEFLQKLGKDVAKTYTKFVSHVASLTGLSEEVITDTQAGTFDAEEGLKLGLLDAVMTREEFFSHLADVAENQKEGKSMNLSKLLKPKEDDSENMSTIDEQAFADLQEQLKTSVDNLAKANEQLVAANEINAELADKVTKAAEQLATLEAYKEEAEKNLAEQRVNTRKEKLAEVVAEDKVEGMYASTEALSDENFATILSGLSVKIVAEEKTDDFKEQGLTGEADGTLQDAKIAKVGEIITKNNSAKN